MGRTNHHKRGNNRYNNNNNNNYEDDGYSYGNVEEGSEEKKYKMPCRLAMWVCTLFYAYMYTYCMFIMYIYAYVYDECRVD